MIHLFRISAFTLLFITLVSLGGIANMQEAFDDPEGKFSLKLPAGWLSIVNKDRVTGKTDWLIVYNVRENGALKVTAQDVEAKAEMTEVAQKHEQDVLRFLPGYTKGKSESFVIGGGARNGMLITYDFKNTAGQPLIGRTYLLRASDTSVYVLRFTGRTNTLGALRNQTDAIARSFKLKQAETETKQ